MNRDATQPGLTDAGLSSAALTHGQLAKHRRAPCRAASATPWVCPIPSDPLKVLVPVSGLQHESRDSHCHAISQHELLSGCGSMMHPGQRNGLMPQKRAFSASTRAHFLSRFFKSQTEQKTNSAKQKRVLCNQVNKVDWLCEASRHQNQLQEGSRTGLESRGSHTRTGRRGQGAGPSLSSTKPLGFFSAVWLKHSLIQARLSQQ